MSDTMAITEISLADLDTVNGGWAKEGLRDFGEWAGTGIDNAGMAVYNAGVATKNAVVATGRAIGNAAVYASDSVRTGVANGLQGAADFVRPPCRR